MPQTANIKKFVQEEIIDLLRAQFGSTFKAYYFGDPIAIPHSKMPCISVEKNSGSSKVGPTGYDRVDTSITVKVIYNKKDDFGNPNPEVTLHRKMMEIVEARDVTTGAYEANTVLGVLRTNLTLGGFSVNQVTQPEYGVVPRPQDTLTEEAHISITIEELVPIPNRS